MKKAYIILSWPLGLKELILPVMNDNGSGEAMLFNSYIRAEEYAANELKNEWIIVEV